jgi:hypothetical protein
MSNPDIERLSKIDSQSPRVGDTWKSPRGNVFRLIERMDDMGNFWWKVQSVKNGDVGLTVIGPRDGWHRINFDIERLAKIDSREVYRDIAEDTFCDSDEWLERQTREWLNWLADGEKSDHPGDLPLNNTFVENESGNRRKEK